MSGSGIVIASNISGCSTRDINGDRAISIRCNCKIISCAATREIAKRTVSKINVAGYNPVTLSLNVAVTKNGAFVAVGEVDVKPTVGAVAS